MLSTTSEVSSDDNFVFSTLFQNILLWHTQLPNNVANIAPMAQIFDLVSPSKSQPSWPQTPIPQGQPGLTSFVGQGNLVGKKYI